MSALNNDAANSKSKTQYELKGGVIPPDEYERYFGGSSPILKAVAAPKVLGGGYSGLENGSGAYAGTVFGSQSSEDESKNMHDMGISKGPWDLNHQSTRDSPKSKAEAAKDKRAELQVAAKKSIIRHVALAPTLKHVVDTSDPMIPLTPDGVYLFTAHRGLLTSGSDYFAEYFRSNRGEFEDKYIYSATSTQSAISFKDGPNGNKPGIEVLQAFTQWLYTQDIQLLEIEEFDFLARAYIFGEKVVHPTFCNAIMDAFVNLHVNTERKSFNDIVHLVYTMTVESSPMRKLLADMYAYTLGDDPQITDLLEWFPSAFLVDLAAAMVRVRKMDGGGWWEHLEGAAYHYEGEENRAEI